MSIHTLCIQSATIILMISSVQSAQAQNAMKWEDFVQSMYDEGMEIDNDMYDELYELHLNPIDLNDTDEQQLRALPFLSLPQIRSIIDYVRRNYPMRSLGELMMIPNIDYITRMRLFLFCYTGEEKRDGTLTTLQNLMKYAQHEAVARTDIPFYIKEGYKDLPDSILAKSPNRIYQGTNNYLSFRYRLSSRNRLFAGIQAEKDAGERGIDYIAAYAMVHDMGAVSTLIAGDYKLSFGHGLVINNGVSFGKLATMNSMSYLNRGITRHSSMSEYNYLRGIAADIELMKNLHFTAFLSYKNVDATKVSDSIDAVSSLKTDGLHRTLLERNKRGILHELTFGGNLQFHYRGFNVGFTYINTHLSMPLQPKHNTPSTLYRLYNLHGDLFGAMGLSYSYYASRYSISGETAVSSQNGAMASINSVQYDLSSITSLSLILRSFDKKYATLYGNTLSENSSPQNESGLMVGFKTEPLNRLLVETYADAFRFPYSKSDASAGSNGFEWLAQVTYMPDDVSSFQVRYRLKSRQKDYAVSPNTKSLYYFTSQNLRLQYRQQAGRNLSFRTTASFTHLFNPDSDNESGYMIAEHVRWNLTDKRDRIDIMAAYFHTDSYAARIYTYEPSLLYAMNMSPVYYHGIKLIGMGTFMIAPRMYVSMKLSSTCYFDRSTIGSGLELIDSSHKEDLAVQFRYVF